MDRCEIAGMHGRRAIIMKCLCTFELKPKIRKSNQNLLTFSSFESASITFARDSRKVTLVEKGLILNRSSATFGVFSTTFSKRIKNSFFSILFTGFNIVVVVVASECWKHGRRRAGAEILELNLDMGVRKQKRDNLMVWVVSYKQVNNQLFTRVYTFFYNF